MQQIIQATATIKLKLKVSPSVVDDIFKDVYPEL